MAINNLWASKAGLTDSSHIGFGGDQGVIGLDDFTFIMNFNLAEEPTDSVYFLSKALYGNAANRYGLTQIKFFFIWGDKVQQDILFADPLKKGDTSFAVTGVRAGDLSLFKNGLFSSSSSIAAKSSNNLVTTLPFRLGSYSDVTGVNPYLSSSKLIIEQFSFWRRALTPEEVAFYSYRKLTGLEPGLEIYLPLDEGSGNIAHNLVPGGPNGTIVDRTWTPATIDLDKHGTLLKSNDTAYTYKNGLFLPSSNYFEDAIVPVSQLFEHDQNGNQPYKQLPNAKLITYTELPTVPTFEAEIFSNRVALFSVSTPQNANTNPILKTYKNDTWQTISTPSQGMTAAELNAIPEIAWSNLADRLCTKLFNIHVYLESQDQEPLLKSIEIEFQPNEAPTISASLSTNSIHNESVQLSLSILDHECDTIYFKVLVKNPGGDFRKISPVGNDEWHERTDNPANITQNLWVQYFKKGQNEVKVITKDSRGATAEWTGHVNMTNADPRIVIIPSDIELNFTVGDDENDKIQYRVLRNGVDLIPWTEFLNSPQSRKIPLNRTLLPVGESVVFTIEAKDELGGASSQFVRKTGMYQGILFKDELGRYYTSDLGEVLQDLVFANHTEAGLVSSPRKIILENRCGFEIKNLKIKEGNVKPELIEYETIEDPETGEMVEQEVAEDRIKDFADEVWLEFSKNEKPFSGDKELLYTEPIGHQGAKNVFVRVRTSGEAHKGGKFYIDAEAEPKNV